MGRETRGGFGLDFWWKERRKENGYEFDLIKPLSFPFPHTSLKKHVDT